MCRLLDRRRKFVALVSFACHYTKNFRKFNFSPSACLLLFVVAFRKDAGASGLLCLLHMQVAIVCCGRHRLSCVGFAGNSVRIYMLAEYR